MHSEKRARKKVDVVQLKEYMRGVKDPLASPPIPRISKEAQEAKRFDSLFTKRELRTQQRFRSAVEKIVKEIIEEKGTRRQEEVKKEATPDSEDRTSMRYSGMVKVGNWEAERAWAEEEMGRFLRLRNRQELGVQRTRALLSQSLEPINLPPKQHLQFGDKVQLIAPRATTFAGRGAGRGLSLSVVLETSQEGAVLSGSPLVAPCSRNVFELCPVRPGTRGVLRHGHEFALRYTGTSAELPYYVAVLPQRVIPIGNASQHPQVHLCSRLCWAAAWKTMPPTRLATDVGKEVSVGGELVVLSANLNRTLTAETKHWFSTLFGLECEATAHDYPTSNDNIWYII